MNNNTNILSVIQASYESLSRTQRRIADYLLQHPDTSCFFTLKQLSAATGTTEATILSFSRQIGCSGFLDMRSKLQSYITQWMSPNEKIKTAILKDDGKSNVSAAIAESEIKALKQTFAHVSEADFAKALSLLKNADRIYLLAYDYAAIVSNVFAERFQRLGVDVVNLGGKSIPDLLYHLALLQPDDLLILFSYAPYTQFPIALARHLHDVQDVKILCFSDNVSAAGAQFADVVLTSVTKNAIFLNSMTAPISLINLLASIYVSDSKERYSAFSENLSRLHSVLTETCPSAEHWLV
ncbi:MurR/RpiR family transcriptional regulator [Oscillibacter hominis]|uniref:MurR/RpiR family transcriptional regulator n=1 Tax=Oscillibacter hominis TaxID=2763056 RepID=A0A7G9B4M6_9FIRM|nr:MurR/RpiR family transcriptional regulator [Oscillibacter hominis]QNL44507.1 MurR/RpiR family transcriptional regulator [Oscillibacter hominis]